MVGLRGVGMVGVMVGVGVVTGGGSPFGGEVDLGSDGPTLRRDLVRPRGGPRFGRGGLVIVILLIPLHADRLAIEFGVK
jgi:hypothetical protein